MSETCLIANGPIEECIWTHIENDEDYSSEDKRKGDIEVKITEDNTLCKLRVKKANIDDHDGLWDVEIIGKCNDNNNNRDRDRDRDRDRERDRKRNRRRLFRRKRQVLSFPSTVIETGAIVGELQSNQINILQHNL